MSLIGTALTALLAALPAVRPRKRKDDEMASLKARLSNREAEIVSLRAEVAYWRDWRDRAAEWEAERHIRANREAGRQLTPQELQQAAIQQQLLQYAQYCPGPNAYPHCDCTPPHGRAGLFAGLGRGPLRWLETLDGGSTIG